MADRSRRFEFGWLEVLGLIFVFALGSVVVFFLGVFVGKGLHESRLAREERVVRLPIDPEAIGVVSTGGSSEPAPSKAPEAVSPSPASGFRLAVRAAPSPTAAPKVRPGAVGSPMGEASPKPVPATPSPRPLPTATPTNVPAALPTASSEPTTGLLGGAQGTWSVQVNATRDAYTARKLVQELRNKGYNAYAVEVSLRGEAWYRVRVGRFPTMQAATAMVVRLKNRERYSRAFLVEE